MLLVDIQLSPRSFLHFYGITGTDGLNSASLFLFPVENLTQSPNINLQGVKWHIDGCYRTDHGSSQHPV